MRSSNISAAATCALALLVVVTLVSYAPRFSHTMDPVERELLSIRAHTNDEEITTVDHHEEDVASKKYMLVSVEAPQPLDALELRRSHHTSSLASIGYDLTFNRDSSIDFGRISVQQSTGFTVVSSFSFGNNAGNWERIFDFGPFWGASGQGMGVLLAREGNSNNLVSHLYPGGNQPPIVVAMNNKIRPNQRMVTVSTYQCAPATTADGTNVAAGKRASASGTYPGTRASNAVNGQPGTRAHPNYWHATANLDWWEVDLGQEFPITKVVFYNRRECCQDRAQDALISLMDSRRNVVNTATLNSGPVQQFNFAPYAGVMRFYMQDGSHGNQLWLVQEVRRPNVPCASASFDHTYVGRSNWGGDALFSGHMGYFSYQSGAMSFGAAASLASAVWQSPQNAPGNFLRTNDIMVPGYTTFDDVFVNPANTRPAIGKGGLWTRPVLFNRAQSNYLNFGRTVAIPDQGITFIASFAFTGVVPGNWERVFDFGSGPDSGNFGLARIGNSNDLLFFANHGGPYTSHVQANNYIRTGKLIVAVCTHRAGITKLYLDGKLVGQSSAKRKPGVVPFSQSFLGRSNWNNDAFLNGQIFYFQQVNWEVSNDHQRAIYNALRRASNSVVGYQPPPPPGPPPAPPAALELRDAPLPCGNNLLANEGLTNEEGTARLIMQADGNLVLYNKNGKALWASGTDKNVGDRLEVQKDGNLVVYQGKAVKWASNTHSNPKGCELVVQDDCNLVLYKSNRNSKVYGVDNALGNFQPKDAIWNSGTFGRCNDPLFK